MAWAGELVVRNVGIRIITGIYFDHALCVLQQLHAVRTYMAQMQAIAGCFVAFCKRVDRFDSGVVGDACAGQFEHHFLRIARRRKQRLELCHRRQQQRAVQLILWPILAQPPIPPKKAGYDQLGTYAIPTPQASSFLPFPPL
ncbi:hypothetical protein PO883_26000 [Massilia sp. DJPM01]|uniref:hypothetical protein n=1 Tax=Massilia sp. DJPM01 TaxID=3024404 RepID=UPI00259EDB6A|nr:hypothetical protein [Massilia sp. DJPM01]MDM5180639.1 hypothetical protein [Massilia sp. DJPM01]